MTATKTKKIAASLAGFSMLVGTAAPAFAVDDPETSAETPDIVLVDTPDEPEEVAEENEDIQEDVAAPDDKEGVADDPNDTIIPMSDEAEPDSDTGDVDDTPTTPALDSNWSTQVATATYTAPYPTTGANGDTIDETTMGVAISMGVDDYRSYLGKKVEISLNGKTAIATIKDTFNGQARGATFNLQPGVATELGFDNYNAFGVRTITARLVADEPTGPSFENTLASTVVERAMAQLGKPYQWGGTGPNGFDASGLVSFCLTGQSVRLGTVATFLSYPESTEPLPGDICVNTGTCGIYIGNGQMVTAPGAGQVVSVRPVLDGMVYRRAEWVSNTPAFKEFDCSISFVDENDKEIAPVVESTIEVAENEALLGSVEELARKNPIAGYSIVRVAAADPEVIDGVYQFVAYCEPNGNGGGNGEGDNNPELPDDTQGKSIAVFCVDEKGNLLDERMVSDTALDDIEAPVLAGWQYVDKYQKDGSHYNDFVPAGSASVAISHWSAEFPDENQMFNPDKNESSDSSVPDFVDIPADGVAISGLIEESAVPSDEDWIGKAIIITTTNGTITANVSGFITNKFGYTIKLGESLSAAIPEDEGIISIEGIELAPSDPNFPEPAACLYFVYNRSSDSPDDNEKPGTETPNDPSTPADPDSPNTPDNPVVPAAPVEKEGDGNTSNEETENTGSGNGEAIVDDQIPETGELVQTGDSAPVLPLAAAVLGALATLAGALTMRNKNN